MTSKAWRWQSDMGASAWCFCGSLVLLQLLLTWHIFWRPNIFRRHRVIDSFLCDCPPTTLYKNTEPQDVYNAPLTCSDYLSELRNQGDFSSNQQAGLQVSMEATQNPKSLWAKMQWSMRGAPSLHGSLSYAGTRAEETPVSHCFNKQQLASGMAMDPCMNLEDTKQ